jgi:hypothetical protein
MVGIPSVPLTRHLTSTSPDLLLAEVLTAGRLFLNMV